MEDHRQQRNQHDAAAQPGKRSQQARAITDPANTSKVNSSTGNVAKCSIIRSDNSCTADDDIKAISIR